MADKIYTNEGVTIYFEMWDGELSPERPLTDDDPAWLDESQVSEVTVTIHDPEGNQEVLSLTQDEVEMTEPGRFRSRFVTSNVDGDYYAVWQGTDVTGYPSVSVSKITAKPRIE